MGGVNLPQRFQTEIYQGTSRRCCQPSQGEIGGAAGAISSSGGACIIPTDASAEAMPSDMGTIRGALKELQLGGGCVPTGGAGGIIAIAAGSIGTGPYWPILVIEHKAAISIEARTTLAAVDIVLGLKWFRLLA